MSRLKFLWYTDTHLAKMPPWKFFSFIKEIINENPAGIFLTGDISTGPFLRIHLRLMAKFINCPIYFVLGNHDYYFTSMGKQHSKIKSICQKYTNLIWLTESDVISLTPDTALIGIEGWYDAQLGNPDYLKFTLDWILIKDFKTLPTMEERINKFKQLSEQNSNILKDKLKKTLEQDYKTIFILTHMVPYAEATRNEGSFMGQFWLPYDVNFNLGYMIDSIMKDRNKENVEIFCGHAHVPMYLKRARNISCHVGKNGIKYKLFI